MPPAPKRTLTGLSPSVASYMILTGRALNSFLLDLIFKRNFFCTRPHVHIYPACRAAVMAFDNQFVQTVIAEPSQQQGKVRRQYRLTVANTAGPSTACLVSLGVVWRVHQYIIIDDLRGSLTHVRSRLNKDSSELLDRSHTGTLDLSPQTSSYWQKMMW